MIYVDPLRSTIPTKRWPYRRSCHLYADTLDELHACARACGLRRCWFQNRRHFPHYDLTPGKRLLAVNAGALETDARHAVEFVRARRLAERKDARR